MKEKISLEPVRTTGMNIYKPGTAKYYRDALAIISGIAVGYSEYNTKSAKWMKRLVDEMKIEADRALAHKKLYLKLV